MRTLHRVRTLDLVRTIRRFRRFRRFRRQAGRAGGNRVGVAAPDVRGTRPDGSPSEFTMAGRTTVLVFLTTSCFACRVLWADLAERIASRSAMAVLVVTPSSTTESARSVAALAPEGLDVIMSSEGWDAFGVRKAPWCVVVAGGRVLADGPAPESWSEVAAVAGAVSPSA